MTVVQVRREVGKRWYPIPAKEMINQSIASYIQKAKIPVMAAMFKGDPEQGAKPVLFISNDPYQVELYEDKGVSLHIDDLVTLLGTTVYNAIALLAIDVFDESSPQFSTVTLNDSPHLALA